MATTAVTRIEPPTPKLVAPRWHTALLIGLFLGLAVSGAFFQRHARSQPEMLHQHPEVVPLYISLIAMEWGLVIYVWRGGLRRTGTKLSELIGGKWANAKDVLVDCGLAIGLWAVWMLFQTAWNRWLGPEHAASIQTYLPQRALEIVLWIGVSISAGFCEELVFRGYFQRQFETFTRSRWIALFLQAVLFGIAHGYQGVEACAKIACFGVLYGLLALWRKSLRPGMIAHAGSDVLSGIFGI
ncbi:MAG: CPBP family intramembrane glutamic endopeptidase [Candidatus Acidiferrales bacterium]